MRKLLALRRSAEAGTASGNPKGMAPEEDRDLTITTEKPSRWALKTNNALSMCPDAQCGD